MYDQYTRNVFKLNIYKEGQINREIIYHMTIVFINVLSSLGKLFFQVRFFVALHSCRKIFKFCSLQVIPETANPFILAFI